MSEIDRIDATRDLVGSFSVLLDEFAACWGGLRIANDQIRSALVEDLIDSAAARTRLAEWIEGRLDREHSRLVAPLLSLLWGSGGSTPGALQAFEVSADPSPSVDAERLARALDAAFDAHLVELAAGPSSRESATELLISAAVAHQRFGVSHESEDDLEQATEMLRLAAFDRDVRLFGVVETAIADEARAVAVKTEVWRSSAVVGRVEVVALPGLVLRHHTLTPLVAPHTEVLFRCAVDTDAVTALRTQLGPAVVTAWDSFGHTFGEEDDGSEAVPDNVDDPFREPGGYRAELGREAENVLNEGTWFRGLLAEDSTLPRLSGPVRALLAVSSTQIASGSGDPHIAATGLDAVMSLDRLATNLGDFGAQHLAALEAKAEVLEAAGESGTGRELADYILRVGEAVIATAEEASTFAEHLASDDGEGVADLDLGLRLAAIVAWLDAVGGWVVSDALWLDADVLLRPSPPPAGCRDPRDLVQEGVSATPERYSVEEFRLVVEQRGMQWGELAVLADDGPPDLGQDWSAVVDIEGFADR